MIWCEVSAAVSVEQAELVAEAMRTVAPAGVAIEDPFVPLGPEEGAWLDRRRPSLVKVYLPVDDRLGERLHQLDTALAALGLRPALRTRTVREEDWADAWKEHFHVQRIGRRIVIRPSWREYTPAPGDVVIDLDPGMAFGTGQHPTTRMCLELLEGEVQPGMGVLDVGTGSGILAIAVIKLGAARCLALDIEPQAVRIARENAVRNGVSDRIDIREGTLTLPSQPAQAKAEQGARKAPWQMDKQGEGEQFDLVLANITATAVASLAPAFAAALRPGGRLIGSGIVAGRIAEVEKALHTARFIMEAIRREGDWCTVLATIPDTPGRPSSTPRTAH